MNTKTILHTPIDHTYYPGPITNCDGIMRDRMKGNTVCRNRVQIDILYPHKLNYCEKCSRKEIARKIK